MTLVTVDKEVHSDLQKEVGARSFQTRQHPEREIVMLRVEMKFAIVGVVEVEFAIRVVVETEVMIVAVKMVMIVAIEMGVTMLVIATSDNVGD